MKLCSKSTINTPERGQWCRSSVFILKFENISHLFLMFILWQVNVIYSNLQHDCQTWAKRVRHEGHKCDTCDTNATRVRHKGHECDRSTTRVRYKWKIFDFDNYTSKTSFHIAIFTIWQVKDSKERKNFILSTTFRNASFPCRNVFELYHKNWTL